MVGGGLGARALVVLALMLIAGCGGGGGGGDSAQQIPAANYLPHGVGDHWSYTDLITGQGTVVHVDRAAVMDGRSGAFVRTTYSPFLGSWFVDGTGENFYTVGPNGATSIPTEGSSPLEMLLGASDIYRLPMQVGDLFVQYERSFDDVDDVDGDGRSERLLVLSTVLVVGLESVSAPAGTFDSALHLRNVITLRLTSSSNGQISEVVSTANDWFAPDVGLVRTEFESRAAGTVIERGTRVLVAYRVGSRSNDPTPAQLLDALPLPGAVGVPPDRVMVLPTKAVDPDSGRSSFTVIDPSGQVHPGTVTESQGWMSWRPSAPMPSGRYEARVSGALIDMAGNPVAAGKTWQFDVDATGPQVVQTVPAADAMRVPIDTPIVVQFNERLAFVPNDAVRVRIAGGASSSGVGSIDVSGSTLTIGAGVLQRGVEYEIELVGQAIRDVYGNPLAANTSWRFVTDAGLLARAEPVFSSGPTSSAIGDLNGDGRLDVVATLREPLMGPGANGLVMRLQSADGTMGPEVDLGWRDTPAGDCRLAQPVVADLNGDGRADIAAATGCNVHVLFQDADGSFTAAPPLDTVHDLRAADIDGDGRVDLVGVRDVTALRVWRQTGAGGLAAPVDVPTGLGGASEGYLPRGLRLADLDGDGRLDVVLACIVGDYTRQQVTFMRQQPDGSFAPAGIVAARVADLAVGDVSGDGRPDVVVVEGQNSNGVIGVLAQRADGSFAEPDYVRIDDTPSRLVLADLDRDGRLDAVVSHGSFGVGFLRGKSGGGFESEQMYPAVPSDFASSAGDLNGDGLIDLLFSHTWLRQLPQPMAGPNAASLRRALGQALAPTSR